MEIKKMFSSYCLLYRSSLDNGYHIKLTFGVLGAICHRMMRHIFYSSFSFREERKRKSVSAFDREEGEEGERQRKREPICSPFSPLEGQRFSQLKGNERECQLYGQFKRKEQNLLITLWHCACTGYRFREEKHLRLLCVLTDRHCHRHDRVVLRVDIASDPFLVRIIAL